MATSVPMVAISGQLMQSRALSKTQVVTDTSPKHPNFLSLLTPRSCPRSPYQWIFLLEQNKR